jgi:hypothetical protein
MSPTILSAGRKAALCIGCAIVSIAAHPAEPPKPQPVQADLASVLTKEERTVPGLRRVDRTVMVPMRDGVRLATDILYPAAGAEKMPAILLRTPYPLAMEKSWLAKYFPRFLQEGYVVVLQNERGKYWSEGEYTFLPRAREDGYDTLEWLSNQPWSNGKIGTFGCSSTAESQLPLMTLGHSAHAAAVPMAPAAAISQVGPHVERGMFYRGGATYTLWAGWYYLMGQRERPAFDTRSLPQEHISRLSLLYDLSPNILPTLDYGKNAYRLPFSQLVPGEPRPHTDFDDFVRRSPGDPRWAEQGFVSDADTFRVPGLWLTSWYDATVAPNLALFQHARATAPDPRAANQFMVIGAGLHCVFGVHETAETVIGDRMVGDARFAYQQLWIDWFDHWLKGKQNGVLEAPRIRYFSFGANRWQSSDVWPPAGARSTKYFLSSVKGANSRLGDGLLAVSPTERSGKDVFVYDPMRPYRSPGGEYVGLSPDFGAYDQSTAQLRNDVLVYSTPPLTSTVEVTGDVTATLYLSSDVKDTDLVVRLVDVAPDGRAYHLVDTIQRVRYREGYDKEVFMRPGQVYKVTLGPMSVSNHFLPGHRIRLEVASSHFPMFERNLNTGGRNREERVARVATNVIHHSAGFPSHVELPIVARGD